MHSGSVCPPPSNKHTYPVVSPCRQPPKEVKERAARQAAKKPQQEARPEEIVQAADDADAEDEATTNRVGTLKDHTRALTYPIEAAAAASSSSSSSPRRKKKGSAEALPDEKANTFDLMEMLVDPEVRLTTPRTLAPAPPRPRAPAPPRPHAPAPPRPHAPCIK